MKATLHKFIGTVMLGLTLFANGLPAWAGGVSYPQVYVGADIAAGSMAGARYSADSQQYIGCEFSNTSGPYILCSATDQNGRSFLCAGFGSQYALAAKSITDYSYFIFNYSPYSSSCNVQVLNHSNFIK